MGSLFSGIGGIDLGLERAGMQVIWQSEIDPYACRVLAKHWPDVPNLGDITTIDWSTVERPDLIAGGYPCQPFSLAGARAGADDRRHLWPYFLNAIRELRPRYALLENVAGHLSLGFGRVLGDLAEIGYDAQWDCIPAAAVGAPHRRDRVFVVAYSASVVSKWTIRTGDQTGQPEASAGDRGRGSRTMANPNIMDRSPTVTRRLFTVPSSRRRIDGTAGCGGTAWGHWEVEPAVGRVAHGVPARVDRLRALGNAVVPQVAEYIGRQLMEAMAGHA